MTREELYFTAYGIPRPQGSKRYVGNGRFVEASNVKPWRTAIRDAVYRTVIETGDERQFTEPVVVYATFFLPRPKTVKRALPSVPPDTDKLQRALGDALSVDAQIVADDSLIVLWVASKVYADEQDVGVRVSVRLATPEELDRARRLQEAADEAEICQVCGR